MRRLGAFTLGSWFVFFCLYLLLAADAQWSELGAGALAATVTVFLVRLLRKKFKQPLRVKWRWLLLFWRIPVAVCAESWQLLLALLRQLAGRQPEGIFIELDFPAAGDRHDAARRAVVTFGICITPNSYLVDFDEKKRRVLLRQLTGTRVSTLDRRFVELP